jgi:hypothetical protein
VITVHGARKKAQYNGKYAITPLLVHGKPTWHKEGSQHGQDKNKQIYWQVRSGSWIVGDYGGGSYHSIKRRGEGHAALFIKSDAATPDAAKGEWREWVQDLAIFGGQMVGRSEGNPNIRVTG